MIEVGVGEDDPPNVLKLNSHFLKGLDLVVGLSRQADINEGEVLGRGLTQDINMGIRNNLVLPSDEINTFVTSGIMGS